MTADLARWNYLRERLESGDYTDEERDEWLRMRQAEIADADKRLQKAVTDFRLAFDLHVGHAVNDLRDRTQGLTGGKMVEAGRGFFLDFERQWGEEAARRAWKEVQPQKRHGRAEWQSIPPARPRAHHTSAEAHFRRFTQLIRADLRGTQPTERGSTISKVKVAREVFGEDAADPARQIRRLKRPPIRD